MKRDKFKTTRFIRRAFQQKTVEIAEPIKKGIVAFTPIIPSVVAITKDIAVKSVTSNL